MIWKFIFDSKLYMCVSRTTQSKLISAFSRWDENRARHDPKIESRFIIYVNYLIKGIPSLWSANRRLCQWFSIPKCICVTTKTLSIVQKRKFIPNIKKNNSRWIWRWLKKKQIYSNKSHCEMLNQQQLRYDLYTYL